MSIFARTLLVLVASLLLVPIATASAVEKNIAQALDCAEKKGDTSNCPTDKTTEDLLDYALDLVERAYNDGDRTAEFLGRIARGFHELGSCSQATQIYEHYLKVGGPAKYQEDQALWLVAHEEALIHGEYGGDFSGAYIRAPEFLECYADYLRRDAKGDDVAIAKLGAGIGSSLVESQQVDFADYYLGKGGVHESFWIELSSHFPRKMVINVQHSIAYSDADADGVPSNRDCDDGDRRRYPGAADRVGDRVDQNCDGTDGIDWDRDGYASKGSGGDDCDDQNPGIHPNIRDMVSDGIDSNCDGSPGIDADGDKLASKESGGTDCDDHNRRIKDGCEEDGMVIGSDAGNGEDGLTDAPPTLIIDEQPPPDGPLFTESFFSRGAGFRVGLFSYLWKGLYPGVIGELYYGIPLRGGNRALRLGAEYRLDYTRWSEKRRYRWHNYVNTTTGKIEDRQYRYLANSGEVQLTLVRAINPVSDALDLLLGIGLGGGATYLYDVGGVEVFFDADKDGDPMIKHVDSLTPCFSVHALFGLVPTVDDDGRLPIEADMSLRSCPMLHEPDILSVGEPDILVGIGLTMGQIP